MDKGFPVDPQFTGTKTKPQDGPMEGAEGGDKDKSKPVQAMSVHRVSRVSRVKYAMSVGGGGGGCLQSARAGYSYRWCLSMLQARGLLYQPCSSVQSLKTSQYLN